jgi:uncharacterized membrane protein YczE
MVKEDIAITNLQKIMSLITFGVIALYFSIKNFSLEFKQTPILWFCSVIAFTLGISSVSYAIRLAFLEIHIQKTARKRLISQFTYKFDMDELHILWL